MLAYKAQIHLRTFKTLSHPFLLRRSLPAQTLTPADLCGFSVPTAASKATVIFATEHYGAIASLGSHAYFGAPKAPNTLILRGKNVGGGCQVELKPQ